MIIVGDALETLKEMESESIDCCITSPPYYNLRDYGVEGQIGLEKNPDEYVSKLVEIFREVRRVLKDDGTLWLNIGDSYAGSGKGKNDTHSNNKGNIGSKNNIALQVNFSNGEIKPKDLIGIPWLVAFALRADGWYLRDDVIWYKPNCMPESVTDRFTKSYEHIFLLSKSRQYYFDWRAVQELAVGFDTSSPRGSKGCSTPNAGRRKGNAKSFRGGGAYTGGQSFDNNSTAERENHGNIPNETGLRRRRNVWIVSTKGYAGAHFATFPPKLIEPCILAGCRAGGTILDPFCGSGTTGEVAIKHDRNFIGIELNPQYAEMAAKRMSAI